jgi:hypothetical protein
VDLQLVLFDQPSFREELADVFALITLQLEHLSVLGMFDHGSIASKLLKYERAQRGLV